MTDKYERGILIDDEGYFLAALRWEVGTPKPDFKTKITKGRRPKLILLRDPYAIENATEKAKWDFTPVREDGTLVRSGTWLLPTVKAWVVRQRRDIPDLWIIVGEQMVWPEREPRLPEGMQLIYTAPPDVGPGRRVAWDSTAEEWLAPRRAFMLDQDGTILNAVVTYRETDISAPFIYAEDVDPVSEDERGELVPPGKGDQIAEDAGVTIRRQPRYRRVPVRLLEAVLEDRGLTAAFVQFVTDRGYTISQVRGLSSISLNSPILRAFVEAQGFTMSQAYTALQRAAEGLLQEEIDFERENG